MCKFFKKAMLLTLCLVFAVCVACFAACDTTTPSTPSEPSAPTTPTEPTEPTAPSTPTVTTEVTESEWADALSFKGVAVKYVGNQSSGTNEATQTVIMNADKTVLYAKEEYSNSSTDECYYAKENEKYYQYEKNTVGDWEKSEIKESEFNYGISIYSVLGTYSDFTYNAEKKVYEGEMSGRTLTLSFANGKLVKYTATGEQNNVTISLVYDFTYENVTITLPTATETTTPSTPSTPTVTTEVTESEWLDALSFKGVAVKYVSSSTNGAAQAVIMNADKTVLYVKEEYGGNVDERYYAKESGKCYVYAKNSAGDWEKSEIEESEFNNLISIYSVPGTYSDFTYNAEEKVYEGEDEGAAVSLAFANGKLVKYTATYEYNGASFTAVVDFTYENVTITLPTATETTNPSTPSEPSEPVEQEPTDGGMSLAEWYSAISCDGVAVQVVVTNTSDSGAVITLKKNTDGSIIYYSATGAGEDSGETYISVEGGKYYAYAYVDFEGYFQGWVKSEVEQDMYDSLLSMINLELKRSDFTYDSDIGNYNGIIDEANTTVTFNSDGKIESVTVTWQDDSAVQTHEYTYEDVDVTLPQDATIM